VASGASFGTQTPPRADGIRARRARRGRHVNQHRHAEDDERGVRGRLGREHRKITA